jgi:hypothetical protein
MELYAAPVTQPRETTRNNTQQCIEHFSGYSQKEWKIKDKNSSNTMEVLKNLEFFQFF